jgi:hypothetical protein
LFGCVGGGCHVCWGFCFNNFEATAAVSGGAEEMIGEDGLWLDVGFPTDYPISGKVPVVRRATLSGILSTLITSLFLLGVFRALNGW